MHNRVVLGFLASMVVGLFLDLCSCSHPTNSNNNSITESSVVGTWTLVYQWRGRTPGVLTVLNFPDQTCLVPSGQNGGPTAIVTGTTTVNGNQFTWVWSEGSSWTGKATSNTNLSGTMVNNSGNSGTWTAQESGTLITQNSVIGTWTMDYQWQGRTPGLLTVVNFADGTCQVPGGQSGGPVQQFQEQSWLMAINSHGYGLVMVQNGPAWRHQVQSYGGNRLTTLAILDSGPLQKIRSGVGMDRKEKSHNLLMMKSKDKNLRKD